MRPLYSGIGNVRFDQEGVHKGLWWSRFFDKYADGFAKPEAGDKSKFVTEIADKPCGDGKAIELMARRNQALVQSLGGKVQVFKTAGRFATGMGNEHPTENGFTWHPTLGTPYLPASSVKGLVRGWIEWNGDGHTEHGRLKDWFGSQCKGDVSEQAGWFVFFDALPTGPVQLAAEVMTPHYDKWYEKGGGDTPLAADTVPADWHSPVPVTFLTVSRASFQFGVAARPSLAAADAQVAATELPRVMVALQEALEWLGAGAKTAVGYGRMLPEQSSVLTAVAGDWQSCVVKFNAGKGVLTVILDGKPVEIKHDDSACYLADCPEVNRTRWKKDKPVNARVRVEILGNLKTVVALEWLPTA